MLLTITVKAVLHMRKAVRIILLITAVMMMFFLFGCSKKTQLDIKTYHGSEPDTMLVDYFERTVGTPEVQPFYELVMYTHTDDTALLVRYTDGGTEDERCDRYIVPLAAAQDAFNAIRDSGMDRWNERKDTVSLNGKMYVCKFPDGSGGYIRVSSERMPEDGRNAFYQVCAAMSAYLKDEYAE